MFSSPCSCSAILSILFFFSFSHVFLVLPLFSYVLKNRFSVLTSSRWVTLFLFPETRGHSDLGGSEVSFVGAWWYTKPAALIVDICQSLWSCKSRQNNVSRNQIPVSQNRSWSWCKNWADDYSQSRGTVFKWKLICWTKCISSFLIPSRPSCDLLVFECITYGC